MHLLNVGSKPRGSLLASIKGGLPFSDGMVTDRVLGFDGIPKPKLLPRPNSDLAGDSEAPREL